MSDNKWEELIDLIDTKYTVDVSEKIQESLEDDPALKRDIQRIEFEKDNVKYRIDRVTSPAIVDKKTHYSHAGSANRVQYVYDKTETSSKVKFYQLMPDGTYGEITPESMLAN